MQAYLLIRSGEAQEYSAEADERYAVLCDSAGEDVVLKSYTAKPWMLSLTILQRRKATGEMNICASILD